MKTAEEHSARRSRQAVAKRAQSSPFEGGSSQKKAQRGSELKLLRLEFLGQKQALRRYSLAIVNLRKRENWPPPFSYIIGIGVIEVLQF